MHLPTHQRADMPEPDVSEKGTYPMITPAPDWADEEGKALLSPEAINSTSKGGYCRECNQPLVGWWIELTPITTAIAAALRAAYERGKADRAAFVSTLQATQKSIPDPDHAYKIIDILAKITGITDQDIIAVQKWALTSACRAAADGRFSGYIKGLREAVDICDGNTQPRSEIRARIAELEQEADNAK